MGILKEGFEGYRKGINFVENKIIHPLLGVPFNMPAYGLKKLSDATNWSRGKVEYALGKAGGLPLGVVDFGIKEAGLNTLVGGRHITQTAAHTISNVLQIKPIEAIKSAWSGTIQTLSRTPFIASGVKKVWSWLPKPENFDPKTPKPTYGT